MMETVANIVAAWFVCQAIFGAAFMVWVCIKAMNP